MTALEPDLRETVPTTTAVDPSQLVAPELPEVDLTARYEANLSGQRPSAFPMPAGARPATNAVVPNLPDAQTAFSRKYARLGPAIQNLPAPVRASLVRLDMQRVNKGQYPLSDKETLAAILAATRKEPTTPQAEKDSPLELLLGAPGAAVRDLTAVARQLPRLLTPTEENPLWQELTSLDDIPESIQKSLDEGDNIITALADAPGIRFIPGSYVVGNLADGTEGIRELAEHPGLALLDVLPYAGKAAKLTKVGKLAANERYPWLLQAEREAQIARGVAPEAAQAAAARYAARKAGAHPLWDVMTKRVADAPDPLTRSQLEPNALGRRVAKMGEGKTGQFVQSAFGRDSRLLAGLFTGGEQRWVTARTGEAPLPESAVLERTARKAREAHLRYEELIPDGGRRGDIFRGAIVGRPGWQDRLGLTDVERQFADEMRGIGDELRENTIKGEKIGVDPETGEVYNAARLRKIEKSRARYNAAVERLVTDARPKIQAEYDAALERVNELTRQNARPGARARGTQAELTKARSQADTIGEVLRLIDDAVDPATPTTMSDLRKALRKVKAQRFSMSSPTAGRAGAKVVDPVTRAWDEIGVARKAAKDAAKEAKKAGQAPAPRVEWVGDSPPRLLDMGSDPVPAGAASVIAGAELDPRGVFVGAPEGAVRDVLTVLNDPQAPIGALYDAVQKALAGKPKGEVDRLFADLNAALARAGYDGLALEGGNVFFPERIAAGLAREMKVPDAPSAAAATRPDPIRPLAEVRPLVEEQLRVATERVDDLLRRKDAADKPRPQLEREIARALEDSRLLRETLAALDDAIDPATPTTAGRFDKNLRAIKASSRSRSRSSADGVNVAADPTSRLWDIIKVDKVVANAKNAADNLEDITKAPPDRWIPAVTDRAEQMMVDRLVAEGVDAADAFEAVTSRTFEAVEGFSEKAWRQVLKSAAPLWKELKDQGFDPQFVPTLARGQEGKFWAGLSTKNRTLSIAKDRTLGAEAPQWGDMAVAYDAAASDMLRDAIQRDVLADVGNMFGRSWTDIVDSFMPEARRRVEADPARLRSTGERAVREEAEAMAKERWVEWSPDNLGPPERGNLYDPDRKFIPRHLMRVAEDSTSTRWGALNVLDPITGTFRVSVLALSPRWHLYNVVGNAIMLAGTEGPQAFRYALEARKVIRAARRGEDVLPERITDSLADNARDLADDTAFMRDVTEGARLRRVLESAPARAGSKLVSGSYRLNGFFDDTTKVMAYESGKRRALKRGWAPDAAEKAGLEAAQRASAFWVEMTPFERGVLRKVFPFYTFTKKIMGLIVQMPLDHPVRTAILANITAAEMEDMGEGLPLDWLNSIGVGDPDEQGNQTRISMSGLNPFSDAPSLFTLKGFLSGMNPVFNAVLVQMGASEAGGPLAFGNRVYDPQTGKLVTSTQSFLPSLVTGAVPQLQSLYRMTGSDSAYNELARNNPAAAQRMLFGGLGMPTPVRTMNESEDRMKSELARITAQNEAWRNALSTGDFSEAMNYPALRPRIAQLQALAKAGLLDQYHPYTTQQLGLAGLTQAASGQAPWPT